MRKSLLAFLHNKGTIEKGLVIGQQVASPCGTIGQLARFDGAEDMIQTQDAGIHSSSRLERTEGIHTVAQPCRILAAALVILITDDQVGAVTSAIPGIILQLILIPILVIALDKQR